ncbi:PEP-CTERM sorting domain-containing protein [Tropicibacter sp. S64]|uniref:PEP-CTERM sorting domain-containing protein n=1 Tax=Tropicibacter sp. S64 TaxID=3415122 RepID=UPI003C7D28A5
MKQAMAAAALMMAVSAPAGAATTGFGLSGGETFTGTPASYVPPEGEREEGIDWQDNLLVWLIHALFGMGGAEGTGPQILSRDASGLHFSATFGGTEFLEALRLLGYTRYDIDGTDLGISAMLSVGTCSLDPVVCQFTLSGSGSSESVMALLTGGGVSLEDFVITDGSGTGGTGGGTPGEGGGTGGGTPIGGGTGGSITDGGGENTAGGGGTSGGGGGLDIPGGSGGGSVISPVPVPASGLLLIGGLAGLLSARRKRR